jgi:hypothetical protein
VAETRSMLIWLAWPMSNNTGKALFTVMAMVAVVFPPELEAVTV